MAESGGSVLLRNVSVEYAGRNGFFPQRVRALENVDLEIRAGAVMGIAGVSGCGKSTLARCAARWMKPSSGEVRGGVPQLVMQDAGASLNPQFTAFEIVDEPLRIQNRGGDTRRIDALLACVGLPNATRFASEFSGGEKVRLAIARALAALPPHGGILILDESLSSLDAETCSQILAMLDGLRERSGLGYVLISHDADLVARVAEDAVIVDRGRIAERGRTGDLIRAPQHDSTAQFFGSMLAASCPGKPAS